MTRCSPLAMVGLVCACQPIVAPGEPATYDRGARGQPPVLRPAAGLLSAHVTALDSTELAGLDSALLVFSTDVDAASLHPRAFLVVLDDGTRVRPEAVALAPANEDDENRSVMLVGELGSVEHPPSDVAVAGPLYAENGPSFYGASAKLDPYAAPGRVITALRIAADAVCPDAAQAVRTYWSDALRGIDDADLSRVRVRLAGEGETTPVGFADRDGNLGEAGEDNVLDLCLAEAAPARRIHIDAGVFADPTGHPTAAIDAPVESGETTQ